eukprot:TRINITY_DN24268_c0_g1_i1.p1 TRINITY_DN24268_c0_g1~~TRINITY_DN24268_c0_g1_i1.p1  ORF type:complete len:466 (+),score=85.53 TRINITY_DN24268_c0_g1_i1:48-1445(+)
MRACVRRLSDAKTSGQDAFAQLLSYVRGRGFDFADIRDCSDAMRSKILDQAFPGDPVSAAAVEARWNSALDLGLPRASRTVVEPRADLAATYTPVTKQKVLPHGVEFWARAALLQRHVRRGDVASAKAEVSTILAQKPNSRAYQAVLHALASGKDAEIRADAKRVFKDMLRRGIRPQQAHYSCMIGATASFREASVVAMRANKQGTRLDGRTWLALLHAATRDGLEDQAELVFSRIPYPTVHHYTCLIGLYRSKKDWAGVERVWERLGRDIPKASVRIRNIRAAATYRGLDVKVPTPLEKDPFVYGEFLAAAAALVTQERDCGVFRRAQEVFEEAKSQRKATGSVWAKMVGVLAAAGRKHEIEPLYREAQAHLTLPSEALRRALVAATGEPQDARSAPTSGMWLLGQGPRTDGIETVWSHERKQIDEGCTAEELAAIRDRTRNTGIAQADSALWATMDSIAREYY